MHCGRAHLDRPRKQGGGEQPEEEGGIERLGKFGGGDGEPGTGRGDQRGVERRRDFAQPGHAGPFPGRQQQQHAAQAYPDRCRRPVEGSQETGD